jgi:hypothetical protein
MIKIIVVVFIKQNCFSFILKRAGLLIKSVEQPAFASLQAPGGGSNTHYGRTY